MPTKDGWLVAEEIVEKVGRGEVSTSQIEKWRKHGLLPYRSRFLGRGKGREPAHYPPKTVDQVRFILKLKKHNHVRSLTDIQVWLWLEGFTVESEKLKKNLKDVIKPFRRFEVDNPLQAPDRATEISKDPKLMRQFGIVTEKAKSEAVAVLTVLVCLFSGLPVDFDSEHCELDYRTGIRLEKMMGMEEARTDQLPPAQPWMNGVPGDYIPRLAEIRLLSLPGILKSIERASQEELERARKNLKSAIRLQPFLEILSQFFTRRFGLGAIKRYAAWSKKHIAFVALAFIHFEHKHLHLSDVLSTFQDRSNEYQSLERNDKQLMKRVILLMRRRIDRA